MFPVLVICLSISLYFAIDAALSIHHDLTCPGGSEYVNAEAKEAITKLGVRGKIALYMIVVGLALVLWPLLIVIKVLVRSKGET